MVHASSAHDLLDLDISTLRQFVEFFPHEGLSKVIIGYLSSGISKHPLILDGSTREAPDLSEGGVALIEDVPLSQEDCLVLMNEGLSEAGKSALAHCLVADFYLSLEEYESAVELTRKGLKHAASDTKRTGLSFQRTCDALNSTLATALVYYQAPRNHVEAKQIFQSILDREPQFTPALIGIGHVLEEEEEYDLAFEFLEQALNQDPSNGRIGAESAWCQALAGDYKTAVERLQKYLDFPQLDSSTQRGRELRAQTLYRIGVCIWELEPSKAARKNRRGAYAMLLAAIKVNPNYAPVYTLLGIFYEDYNKDHKRARQCFQKACELSPSEIVAAERLARLFAGQGQWDIVEIVSQRVIDSGKARQISGSKKKKGISWPFSALGVVQMNKQEYHRSITSFLSALRINPNDYHSYVGLGESYHNSGRFNSANRAFCYAENQSGGTVAEKTKKETWFTQYMLANVNRELGEFDSAIQGYDAVLTDRPAEFGVSIALLQTLVEKGWRCIETGFYGEAVDSAVRAIKVAPTIADFKPDAFNLWRAVGDACSLFTYVQGRLALFSSTRVVQLLRSHSDIGINFDAHKDIDGIGRDALIEISGEEGPVLPKVIKASILAQKRSISSCAHDTHAQAVAWYNLGWAEYRGHVCLEQESSEKPRKTHFLQAAMKCFKRAIELEAGNAEFWNSLGVVTTTLSPKVAQHALVRSLYLNERNVHTWTNFGALCLLQKDLKLAHQAFSRAQSQDPDYSLAWIGEGIIALMTGNSDEAHSHFTHAFELAESSLLLTKRQYSVSAFDILLSSSSSSDKKVNLIQPLFALQQLRLQVPSDVSHKHLSALFLERIGNYDEATLALRDVTAMVEQEYEECESPLSLAHVVQAKTDLARNLLATGLNQAAVEEAETVLDLASELESEVDQQVLSSEQQMKIKLSARLVAGLAHYFDGSFDAALPCFRTALETTASNPDIICLLAEVLWAKGGESEKQVAHDQLFTAIEKHDDHVGLITLVGAMTVLNEDMETMEVVKGDLDRLRVHEDISDWELARIEKVIEAISLCLGGQDQELNEARHSIMLRPWKHTGWIQLADASHDSAFASMIAKENATRSAPPHGTLDAAGLACAMSATGNVSDIQRAIVLMPWLRQPWAKLRQCINNV